MRSSFTRHLALLAVVGCFVTPPILAQSASRAETSTAEMSTAEMSTGPFSAKQMEESLEGDFGAAEIAATNGWIEQLNLADWLGPLAPVAMSPFFAVTCLSGLAFWGPESITNNALLGSAGPLQSESLFFVLLALTILTSLPRLTKVSKPFAQAVDRLETYAVIVINILMINSVKFFFEFLIWLTPIPFLDAVFEVCNKSLCAMLLAVYAFNPAIATLLNLTILFVAALMLRWISRRVRFYRTMILDPVIARLWTAFGEPAKPELIVFPKNGIGPFKPKSRLRLTRAENADGWHLEEANWWMPASRHFLVTETRPSIRPGWVMHTIVTQTSSGPCELTFSRRYDRSLPRMAENLGLELPNEAKSASRLSHEQVSYEFS